MRRTRSPGRRECPRLQTSGTTNPDGWGVAWYVDGDTTPDRYRTVTPIWEDRAFADRAHDLRSGAFLAAARLASPGASLVDTGNAPFVAGRWSFSLNGIVYGFRDGVGDALRARVRADRLASVVGDADTEVLFALVLQDLDDGAGTRGRAGARRARGPRHDHRAAQPAPHRRRHGPRHTGRELVGRTVSRCWCRSRPTTSRDGPKSPIIRSSR